MTRAIDPVALTRAEVEAQMLEEGRCCDQGVIMPCTCLAPVECDIHGSICVGQHLDEMVG